MDRTRTQRANSSDEERPRVNLSPSILDSLFAGGRLAGGGGEVFVLGKLRVYIAAGDIELRLSDMSGGTL